MADYLRKGLSFLLRGLVLSRPINQLTAAEVAVARNIRSYTATSIQQRAGQTAVNATALTAVGSAAIHTIRRLNDEITTASNPYLRIVGAGTGLYAGTTFATGGERTAIATGFDGNPLALIPHRPTQSPEPFMYVGNANKLGKVKDDRTYRNMGIAPPTTPPTGPSGVGIPALNSFQFATIESGITAAAGWTVDATVVTAVANGVGPTDTMTAVLFDAGTTGWANVVITPTDARFYQAGFMVATNTAAETIIMDSIYKAVKTTTIAAIAYDSGTTGLCTIQLTAHKRKALVPNAVILINSGGGTAEYVRVLSVSFGDDDIPSLRCSTVNTHAAAESITGVISWRAYFANNHAAAETYTFRVLSFQCGAGIAAGFTGTGYGNKVTALDLSNVAGRPIQDDDELNFIIFLDTEKVFTEVQVMLDCGDGSFTGNYFLIVVRPSDFASIVGTTPSATTVTAKQKKIQLDQIDEVPVVPEATIAQIRERLQRRLAKVTANGNVDRAAEIRKRLAELDAGSTGGTDGGGTGAPSSTPVSVGTSQYIPVHVKIKDIARVGTDFTKNWAEVNAIRIRVSINNQTGAVASPSINFGSFWIGGSFGPDVGETGTPYIYRYRYRASESGAISRPSPATRSGVLPHRQRVQLTAVASADAQADKIDWFRFGGTLTDWRYIGTGANSTATFNDDFPDDSVGRQGLEFDRYQPFPVVDLPRTGTANASGTAVTRTAGDTFNTAWAPGSRIIVSGLPVTIYRVISTALLETVENLGALSAVSFFLPDPLIQGQPLPAMWGPFIDSDGAIRFLACGAPSQAGTLFITTGNDPDSAPAGVIGNEITSPSEPLMNGCIFDGRAWVFSNQRLFHVQVGSAVDVDGVQKSAIRFQEVPNSRGLFARYGLCVTPQGIVFIAADGIYITNGGEPQSLTDGDLYGLFPHDGQAGTTSGGVAPPDFTAPNAMGLTYGDGLVKFWFTDTGAVRRTFVRNMAVGGWQSLDTYNVPISCHYYEEGRGLHSELGGGTDGRLYAMTGTTDAGAAITSQVRLGADDAGDPRAQKKYGDCTLDYTATTGLTATIGFDDYATLLAPQSLGAKAARVPVAILDINSGSGQEAVNVTMDVTWTDATVILYEWTFSLLGRPESIQRRITDEDNLGFSGPKYIRGLTIEADTANIAKAVLIQGDTGTAGVMVTQSGTLSSITHNGRSRIDYAFTTPFIAHLVRLLPNDATAWRLFDWQWVYDQYPPLNALISSIDDNGYFGAKYVRGLTLEADSANAAASVQIWADSALATTISATHNGKTEITYAFATPFIAYELQFIPQNSIRIFRAKWIYDPYPDLKPVITPWTDAGWDGPKWLEGIRLTADTANAPVSVVIQYDGETAGPTISATHNGQVTIDYALATPIIGHNFRIVPAGNIRIFAVDYIYEREAPLVTDYISQVATDDQKSYCHIRDGEFGYISTAAITLTLVLDGVAQPSYTLPSSSGVFIKSYLPFSPVKFKTRQFKFHSTAGFRLYRRAAWIRMKPWAGQAYQRVAAFGETHATTDGSVI